MEVVGLRHLGLKGASIVLGVALWLLVSGEQTVERALRIPLEFAGLPAQIELIGEPPDSAEVRIRGSSGTLGRVAVGELAAVLDVGTARPGLRLFHLGPEDVRAPFGVEVVQVSPATLALTFEASSTRMLVVAPRIEGDPAPGFVVSGVVVEPASVAVSGPAGAIANLTEVVTEAVSVAGAADTVTETVTVGVADPSVRVDEPRLVRVRVLISTAPVEWMVPGLRIETRGGTAVDVSPDTVTAHVRGPGAASGAGTSGWAASVELGGLPPGTHLVTPRVEVPAGISLLRVEPAEVRVTIR